VKNETETDTLTEAGWELRDGERPDEYEIAKEGRASLTMICEPGMDPEIVAEYATTRALEADVEDSARALIPDLDIRSVMTALWQAPPDDPDSESGAIREARSLLSKDHKVGNLRRKRDQHVAHSQASQVAREMKRRDKGK
jgi:hypothetical protein